MKQYYPSNVKMPEPGEVRELVDRSGMVVAIGIVYGLLPKKRIALIRELKLDDKGCVTYAK